MRSEKRPRHSQRKRAHPGDLLIPTKHGPSNAFDEHRFLEYQDQLGGDSGSFDADSTTIGTSSASDAFLGLQDLPNRKNKTQLTSTEYALQEIRNRVRAIDERWEEVNVRAINTLDNIHEDELDRRDPERKRTAKKRRDADRKFSLRGIRRGSTDGLSRGQTSLLEGSHATAWFNGIGDSGRAVTRDERVAVALAESHENLAVATMKFEESQERNYELLGGLRGWMDNFTGTSRPEDTNPIAAMLPDPEMESEVVGLMTDCQDAALMLEQSTKQHTKQLREIFSQAGQLYGSEMDRIQKKGSAATGAARETISNLQAHANSVETLLNSMKDERSALQTRFTLAEQRCRSFEDRYREDKAYFNKGLTNYRHEVVKLQHVVAGYETKARRQEQLERDPHLGPVLDMLKTEVPTADPGQLKHFQDEATRLATENAVLTEAQKKLHHEVLVLRLARQGGQRAAGRQKSPTPNADAEAPSLASSSMDSAADEKLRQAKEHANQVDKKLVELERENELLADRLKALRIELDSEKKKPTVINNPPADTVEQNLRGALRDLRKESNGQRSAEIEARDRAVAELEAALRDAREKESAAAAVKEEIAQLQAELTSTKGKLQALHQPVVLTEKPPPSSSSLAATDRPPVNISPPPAATVELVSPQEPPENDMQPLLPVDFASLVSRAIRNEEGGLKKLEKKAEDAGVARRHCEKVQKVFSDVVDSCEEGVSSVERILGGTAAISDVGAANIQEALSLSLEKSIAASSVLLREAFIGRIRACEAEKQVLQEKEITNEVRARAEALVQERIGLIDELQQQHAQAIALQNEISKIHQEMEARQQEAHPLAEERKAEIKLLREDTTPSQEDSPPPIETILPPPIDDSTTWQRRYQHLADLLANLTKNSIVKRGSHKSPMRPMHSPRTSLQPTTTPKTSVLEPSAPVHMERHHQPLTSTIGVQSETSTATRVDASSSDTSSFIDLKAKVETSRSPVLVSTGVSASGVSPDNRKSCSSATTGVETERKTADIDEQIGSVDAKRSASNHSEAQFRGGDSIKTLEGGTQVDDLDTVEKGDLAAQDQAVETSTFAGTSSAEEQKQHNRQLPDDLGFISAESKTEKTAGSLDMVSRAKKTPDPGKAAKRSGRKNLISVDAIHKDNIAPAKEKTIAKAKRDAGGIDKLPGVADKKKSEKSNRERERALKGHGDLTIAAGVQSTAGFTEGKNKRGSSAAGSCKTTERKKKSSIHERRQAHEEFDDETASAATTPTESDESKLLEKLLDENAPSPEFEDDHHKLLQKFLRVRDGENAMEEIDEVAVNTLAAPQTSCLECPMLRQSVADQLAEGAREREQHLETQRELEASEHRIYVMTSDNASLKRKLAEHVDILRHAQALASKVASAPGTALPQARAALDFKELSDRVASGRISGVSRSPKGKAATGGRGERQQGSPKKEFSRGGHDIISPESSSASTGRGRAPKSDGNNTVSDGNNTVSDGNDTVSDGNNTVSDGNNNVGAGKSTPWNEPDNVSGALESSAASKQQVEKRVGGEGGPESTGTEPLASLHSEDAAGVVCNVQGGTKKEETSMGPQEGASDEVPNIAGALVPKKIAKEDAIDQSEESIAESPKHFGLESTGVDVPIALKDDSAEPSRKSQLSDVKSPKVPLHSSDDSKSDRIPIGVVATPTDGNDVPAVQDVVGNTIDVPPARDVNVEVTTFAAEADPAVAITREADKGGGQPKQQLPPTALSETTRQLPRVLEVDQVTIEAWPQEETSREEAITVNVENGQKKLPQTSSWAEDVLLGEPEGEVVRSRMHAGESRMHATKDDVVKKTVYSRDSPATEYIPTEHSLAAYCKAAARCKIDIEALESDNSDGGEAKETGDGLDRLNKRYSELIDDMTTWGVEAAAALLIEVANNLAKHKTISARTATTMGDWRGESSSSSQARRDKSRLLLAEQVVLREIIDALGGWEAAVFLSSGGVNLDVDVSVWPAEDQLAMLMALNDHLRDELEESGQRHNETVADLLHRLQAAEREKEQLGARRENPMPTLHSPIAVPEEGLQPAVAKSTPAIFQPGKKDHRKKRSSATKDAEAVEKVLPCAEENGGKETETFKQKEKQTQQDVSIKKDTEAEATKKAKRDIELELTMALASLKKSQDDLRKEKNNLLQADKRHEEQQHQQQVLRDKEPILSQSTHAIQPKLKNTTLPEKRESPRHPQPQPLSQPQSPPQLPLPLFLSQPRPEPLQQPRRELELNSEPKLEPEQLPEPGPQPQLPEPKPRPQPPLQPQPQSQPQSLSQPRPQLQPQPHNKVVQPRGGDLRRNKGLDLIAQADLAERRAREQEQERLHAGYPLEALAAERKAIADLHSALTKTLCVILEVCRSKPILRTGAAEVDKMTVEGEGSLKLVIPEGSVWRAPSAGVKRGPPSTLVQMVCSGVDADVRCSTSEYRLSTGVPSRSTAVAADSRTSNQCSKVTDRDRQPSSSKSIQSFPSQPEITDTGVEPCPSKFREAVTNIAQAGTEARLILRSFMDISANGGGATKTDEFKSKRPLLPSPELPPMHPEVHPGDSLSAARVAAADIDSFSAEICKVSVDTGGDLAEARVGGGVPWTCGATDIGRISDGRNWNRTATTGTISTTASPEVDTTATTKIVDALRMDVLLVESLPAAVRKALEAQVGRFDEQFSLKDREIEILTEKQDELRRDLRALKADYVNADADDVIRALRKSLRGLNDQVRSLERQLRQAQQSLDIDSGAIEVFEGLLRQRDVDKELYRGLGLRSLEVGLKIRLLETEVGGKTLEVSRMDQKEQRAVAHLKERLYKERGALEVRQKTVAAELERSLPHGMRAFERVSRAIQRLCNGYTSLPGLLEWGRTNAARLEASGIGGNGGIKLDDRGADTSSLQPPVYAGCSGGWNLTLQGEPVPAKNCGALRQPTLKPNQARGWGSLRPNVAGAGTSDRPSSAGGGSGFLSVKTGSSSAWSPSATESLSSASTSAFAGRTPLASSCQSVTPETTYYLPKMTRAGAHDFDIERVEAGRRRLRTAGYTGGGGVLRAAENGQSKAESAWGVIATTTTVGEKGGDNSLARVGTHRGGGSCSSVASLLREERAFQRRNGAFRGPREGEKAQAQARGRGIASMLSANQTTPALVPLNNVGLPVRFRQQPRRNQGLRAAR